MKYLITIIIIFSVITAISEEAEWKDRYEYYQKRHKNLRKGSISEAYQQAQNQKNLLINKYQRTRLQESNPSWEQIGPGNIGGRIRDVEVSRTNPDKVWFAAAAGGIWHSEDGGMSWRQIFDENELTSFGSIAVDPNNEDIIYAATGEGNYNIDSYPGKGIYKTTNGGASWFRSGLADVTAFNRIFVHPQNSNLILAGGFKGRSGIYKSEDAGKTWDLLRSGPITDVSISEQDQNTFIICLDNVGVFLTEDGGSSFQSILPNNQDVDQGNLARISAQFYKKNDNIIWVLIEQQSNGNATMIKSNDKGRNWTTLFSNNGGFFGVNNQGFYNNFVEIHPDDPNTVISGGIDLFRTTNGNNFFNISDESPVDIHVDQHTVDFCRADSKIGYLGNDGGIYKTTDAGRTWISTNNDLFITQFYGIDVDQRFSNAIFGGTQDNNNITNRFSSEWQKIGPGDGFEPVIDNFDPEQVFIQVQFGVIFHIDFRKALTTDLVKNLPSRSSQNALFFSPLRGDYNNPLQVYHGGRDLWRFNANNLNNNWQRYNIANSGLISVTEPAKLNSNVIWVGTEEGELFLSTNGGNSFSSRTSDEFPNLFLSDIQTSRFDSQKLIISFTGYGGDKLFISEDQGGIWKNISSNLPDVPINDIEFHPEDESIIYIGTDIGVFASYDSGETWFVYGKSLPNSPILDIDIYTDERALTGKMYLIAATHGRSTFRTEIVDVTSDNNEIIRPAGGEIFFSGKTAEIIWFGDKDVEIFYSDNLGDSWNPADGYFDGGTFIWNIPDISSENCMVRVDLNGQNLFSRLFTIRQITGGSILEQQVFGFASYGLELGANRELYVVDFNSNRIRIIDADNYNLKRMLILQTNNIYFTDIEIDGDFIYTSRLVNENGGGSIIEKYDLSGRLVSSFNFPSSNSSSYPIGIAITNDQIILNDRETSREIYYLDINTFELIGIASNDCDKSLGPRGITDMEGEIIQACTIFNNKILEDVIVSSQNSDFEFSLGNIFNARGIAYDPLDGNFWISTFQGQIIKVGGFGIVSSVKEGNGIKIYPNPTKSEVFITNFETALSGIKIIDNNGFIINNFNTELFNSTLKINTNNLVNGIYYVILELKNGKKIFKKLVKVD